MSAHGFPRLPYDEVQSPVIRETIRAGSFADPQHRQLVNDLVYAEWYATEGLAPGATGLSAACAAVHNWRIAARRPERYDAVRRAVGAETRTEYTLASGVKMDVEARRRWTRRHRQGWRAAHDGIAREPAVSLEERPRCGHFRFPEIPYAAVESPFVLEELRRGTFDDLEHREYVNRLVYLETWTRLPGRIHSGGYPKARPWVVAAKHPAACDRIRTDLDASPRAELAPFGGSPGSESELDPGERRRKCRHAREWRRVQERDEDG